MALTKNLQAIKNKWRIENLYYKNWRNAPQFGCGAFRQIAFRQFF